MRDLEIWRAYHGTHILAAHLSAGPRRFRKEGGRGLANLPADMGRLRWTNNSALLYIRIWSQKWRSCLLYHLLWSDLDFLSEPTGKRRRLGICFGWKPFRGGERGWWCRRFGRCTDSAEGDKPPPRALRVKWYQEQRRNSDGSILSFSIALPLTSTFPLFLFFCLGQNISSKS